MTAAALVRADALHLPLRDASVDLVVTSPPYWALRSYQDDGEHYDGQIGSEPRPADFLAALWAVTAECVRVLKPGGSIWVNLGDKYAGSGSHNQFGSHVARDRSLPGVGRQAPSDAARRQAPVFYSQASDVRSKSLMGLPWLYALGCTGALAALGGPDPGLNLVLRAEVVWSKPNGLPESVTDRVRRSHEQWFHLTRESTYFAAVDEIREPQSGTAHPRRKDGAEPPKNAEGVASGVRNAGGYYAATTENPLGKLPGSVWTVPGEPLRVPEHLPQHFAAFPQEWPRRLILGWSPSAWCTACEEPRRPVVTKDRAVFHGEGQHRSGAQQVKDGAAEVGWQHDEKWTTTASIEGYRCACPDTTAPTRPSVVLDPFGGTGTVAMVARALGRTGISIDLSADYLRLAQWRVFESGHAGKAIARTWADRQGALL